MVSDNATPLRGAARSACVRAWNRWNAARDALDHDPHGTTGWGAIRSAWLAEEEADTRARYLFALTNNGAVPGGLDAPFPDLETLATIHPVNLAATIAAQEG